MNAVISAKGVSSRTSSSLFLMFIAESTVTSKPTAVVEEEFINVDSKEVEGPKLQGNRWYLQKATGPATYAVTPDSIGQALSIEDCNNVSIKLEGKLTTVVTDQCKQLDLEVADVVSNVELLRCVKVRLFLRGHVPTVVLDECEEIQIMLNEASKDVRVLTSKCAEINFCIAKKLLNPESANSEEAEDLVEFPVPMQFISTMDLANKQVPTVPVQHVGV